MIIGGQVLPKIIKVDNSRQIVQLKNPYSTTEKTEQKNEHTFGNMDTGNKDLIEMTEQGKLNPIFKPSRHIPTAITKTTLVYDSN